MVLMNHPDYDPKEVPEEAVKKFERQGWVISGVQVAKKRGRPFKDKVNETN